MSQSLIDTTDSTVIYRAGLTDELFDEHYEPLSNGLPGPLPQAIVDAADPDVNPGRAPQQAHHRADATGQHVDEAIRLAYWDSAGNRLQWDQPFETIHSWTKPDPDSTAGPVARWYDVGQLNDAANCLAGVVAADHATKFALDFECESGDRRDVTYADLIAEVAQTAHALTELGIKAGDRVVVYLPVIVETVVIALAFARIGAVHSLVFGGF